MQTPAGAAGIAASWALPRALSWGFRRSLADASCARRLGPARAPVDERRRGLGGLALRDRDERRVPHGLAARRIGRRSVAGDGEGLAAATAEVDLAPLAATARLDHPIRAAELLECLAVQPDLRQRLFAHVVENEARDRLRGMTGQHLAGGRDVDD